ncbi:MAG: hypothetical protein WBP11_04790 [Dokdonella sp.]
MKFKHAKLALAMSIAAVVATPAAHAAIRFSEAMDGLWFNTNAAATGLKGWDFDYLVREDGRLSSVFMIGNTFDANGNAVSITTNFEPGEFEYEQLGLPVAALRLVNGVPTYGVIGNLDVRMESCSRMTVNFTPANASDPIANAIPRTQDLRPGQFLADGAPPRSCVVKREFTACPSGTTAGPSPRSCVLSGNISSNFALTNETTWLLNGLVTVGGDNVNKTTLSIEPGTLITGIGNTADYLYVNPGSKLIADGTPYAPIIFTSPEDGKRGATPRPKDWGGVVLSGNAPNNKCFTAPFDCRSEFNPALRYGGNDANDSSGVMRYVQVRYAGYVFTEGREVNSFTFQAVGNGTVLEHLQSYRGGDDGYEWFGGTVNAKYLVATEGGDDGFDWDEGFSGKIQFGLVTNDSGLGEDNGIEASNQANNLDATPRAIPRVANITFIGNGTGGNGINLKEGTGGHIINALITGYDRAGKACLTVNNPATSLLVGTPALTIDHSLIQCATSFGDGSGATAGSAANLFGVSGAGNLVANPLLINGFLPMMGSPALNGGRLVTEDVFFSGAPYIGAFRDASDDWTLGWTHRVKRN